MTIPAPGSNENHAHEQQQPILAPYSLSKAEDPMPPSRSLYHLHDANHQITAIPKQSGRFPHSTDAYAGFIDNKLPANVQLHLSTSWPIPTSSRANEPKHQTQPELKDLPAPRISKVSSGYRESATSHCGGRKRIVKVRDRKITSCTQCRDRKLRCSKESPCSRCREKGEQCIYIDKARDLHLAPKRNVKKRKRPINVCLTCRDRKIPCNKGLPCANCIESGLECAYRRYKRTGSPVDAADVGTSQALGVMGLNNVILPPQSLNVNLRPAQIPSSGRQNNFMVPKEEYQSHGHHQHIGPTLQHVHPLPGYQHEYHPQYVQDPYDASLTLSNGPYQLWQASLTDNYNPVHDDEGYGSVGSIGDYKNGHSRNHSTGSSYYTAFSESPEDQKPLLRQVPFGVPNIPFAGHPPCPPLRIFPLEVQNRPFEGPKTYFPPRNLSYRATNLSFEGQIAPLKTSPLSYEASNLPFHGPLPPMMPGLDQFHGPPPFQAPQSYPSMRADAAKTEPGMARVTAHMYGE